MMICAVLTSEAHILRGLASQHRGPVERHDSRTPIATVITKVVDAQVVCVRPYPVFRVVREQQRAVRISIRRIKLAEEIIVPVPSTGGVARCRDRHAEMEAPSTSC